MTLKRISEVKLLPRGVPVGCESALCRQAAQDWLVSPDGVCVAAECPRHAKGIIDEYREKLGEEWTLAPIHHEADDATLRDREAETP